MPSDRLNPLARKGVVLFATLAGGAVVGVPGELTHTLDPITAEVWRHADGSVDVEGLARQVGASELDVWQSLDKLADARLLEVHPAPRGGAVAPVVGGGRAEVAPGDSRESDRKLTKDSRESDRKLASEDSRESDRKLASEDSRESDRKLASGDSRESDRKLASGDSRESDRKLTDSRESDRKLASEDSRESDRKLASEDSRESDRKLASGDSRESDRKLNDSRESDRKLA